MYKYVALSMLFFFILFSAGCTPQEKPAITIGTIKITADEFETAFSKSIYAHNPTEEAKQGFLTTYINRKLILKEAEREGLDKDKEFLTSVQLFWEQSLLKLVLNAKIKEVSAQINIKDEMVQGYFQTHKEEFFEKELPEVYDQIKLELFKQKQKELLDEWINSLHNKTKIEIDYTQLGFPRVTKEE